MDKASFLKANPLVLLMRAQKQAEEEADEFNKSEENLDEEDEKSEYIGDEEDDYRDEEKQSEDGEYESSFVDDTNVNEEDVIVLRRTVTSFTKRVGGSAYNTSPPPKRHRDF